MTERSELENFFLACIEEVRKDILKRKSTSATYSNKKPNMKKSNSSRDLEDNSPYASASHPKLEDYTATDKRRVIELLMSNENVLLFLYEKLFPVV